MTFSLPLAFSVEAGTGELDFSGLGKSILLPNRRLRDVLLAKGYELHYQEFVSGTYLSWRGTLADGLDATFLEQLACTSSLKVEI